MLTLATWNVNSIRARLERVLAWVTEAAPDVLLFQELKTLEVDFPLLAFQALGYQGVVVGQKAWNGVALLSRLPIESPLLRLPGEDEDEQARYVEATIKGVRVASLYLPNGNPVGTDKYPYKLRWMDRLYRHAQTLLARETPLVLAGDFNVIPAPEDVYNPDAWADDALFTLATRKAYRKLMYLGLTDAYRALDPAPHRYTFWDYQAGCWPKDQGLRIDHFLVSSQAADRLSACIIDRGPRGLDKASDHTPVVLSLDA